MESCDTPDKLIKDIYSDGLIPFRDLCRKTLADVVNTVEIGSLTGIAVNTMLFVAV